MRVFEVVVLSFCLIASGTASENVSIQSPSESCIACQKTIGYLQAVLSNPDLYQAIIPYVIGLCDSYLPFILPECIGFITSFEGTASTAVAKWILNYERICTQFEYCSEPKFVKEDFKAWTDKVLASKPHSNDSDDDDDGPVNPFTFTFAHLSDIHIDFDYLVGGTETCGEVLCCRDSTGTGSAGQWVGSYRCDLPTRTLEASLEQLVSLNPEFIIITGDIPPHIGFNESVSIVLEYQKAVADTFKKIVPPWIPVFPIYGNHGSFPINQHNYLYSDDWLPGNFSKFWGFSPSQTSQLRNNAGYSVKYPYRNLRLIALDTQTGNNQNIWLLQNSTDPKGIVSWLYKELLDAESHKEKVYIFGHIPFGFQDTLTVYSRHMNVLVDRFENTIAGIFFGHLHYETSKSLKEFIHKNQLSLNESTQA